MPLRMPDFRLHRPPLPRPVAANNPEKTFNPYVTDAERDARTGPQWLRSTIAYLNFRAGHAWRRLSDPKHRNNPERLDYLDAIRIVQDVICAPEPDAPAFPRPSEPIINPVVAALAQSARGDLVNELLNRNPVLHNRKLLMHLSRQKLARMVVDARLANEKALQVVA